MLRIALTLALIFAVASPGLATTRHAPAHTPHTFTAEGDHFALDGKPFKVLSGEMHYSRIPASTGTPASRWPKRWA